MARIKLEFAAQRAAERGIGVRERLLARLPELARWGSRLPALFNLRDRLPGAAARSERWRGVSARRRLPQFRRDPFVAQAPRLSLATRDETLAAAARDGRAAVLFVDTFNGWFETENVVAAVRVLQAAGYAVHAATRPDGGALCCGRTRLAVGLVDDARARARELLAAAAPFGDAGIAIVGLEPSCLLTLRDEYLVLGLGPGAPRLAAQALLFEEFIAREAAAGRLSLPLRPASAPLLVHGHCHQKAAGAMPPVLAALRLIPGADVSVIESSCCGMAGAFGYEATHHAVSMQMAELSLLPAVRDAPDAIIVADGTSCRHQIADGAGRTALHAARVLADHLDDAGAGAAA
jgi:Fe-S oxidoreductase